jgi:hypothetical protein
MTEQTLRLAPGCTVVIAAFDDVPEHRFQVEEILDDCITGIALTGPFAGDYGEPELALILRVVSQD